MDDNNAIICYDSRLISPYKLVKYKVPTSLTQEEKSTVVESILLKVRLPKLYIVENRPITGLGIVDSIVSFLNNIFHLKSLKCLLSLEGQYFRDLPKNLQTRLEENFEVFDIRHSGDKYFERDLIERIKLYHKGMI